MCLPLYRMSDWTSSYNSKTGICYCNSFYPLALAEQQFFLSDTVSFSIPHKKDISNLYFAQNYSSVIHGVQKKYQICLPVFVISDRYSENSWHPYNSSGASFMYHSFIESGARLGKRQKTQNIAKISISADELHRPICGLHRIASSKLSRISKEFITTIRPSNTAFLIFKITAYWDRSVKTENMPNTGYADQQKTQCWLWMTDGLERTAVPKRLLNKYFIQA